MKQRWRYRIALFFAVSLVILTTIPVLATWFILRRQQLNRDLIFALKKADTDRILALLQDGAEGNARDEPHEAITPSTIIMGWLQHLRGQDPQPSTALTGLAILISDEDPSFDPRKDYKQKPYSWKVRIARALLKHGASGASEDRYGYTALMWAADHGDASLVRLLLRKGADVNASDKEGRTALMCAVENGDKSTFKAVLNAGADVNAVAAFGVTALMHASDPDTIQSLIKKEADVNRTDIDGRTALMQIIENAKDERCIRILLQAGADLNKVSNGNDTALSLARLYAGKKVVHMLKAAGATK